MPFWCLDQAVAVSGSGWWCLDQAGVVSGSGRKNVWMRVRIRFRVMALVFLMLLVLGCLFAVWIRLVVSGSSRGGVWIRPEECLDEG